MPIILDGQEKYYQNVGPSLYEQYVAKHPQTDKPTYADSYSGQLGDLYNKINNRSPFSYDASKDPLYQSYKDQYIQGGKLAMKDTMGQAAALTGGYANTYGQQVGQQAYDAYLQNLGEVVPQLYNMAYQQYQDQGDALTKQYAMLGDLRDQEYGRYRDALGDWEGERNYAAQLEAEDYKRRTAAETTAYNRQQDAYANLYAAIKASGYVPSDYELQAAGMTRAAADAIAAEYQRGVNMDERTMALKEWSTYNSGSGGGSSGGGGGGGRSGGGGGSYGDYYNDVNDAAMQAAWAANVNRGSTSNTGTLPIIQAVYDDDTLSASQKDTIRQNVVTTANANVNRSAMGSPTATASQNMGGSGMTAEERRKKLKEQQANRM